MYHQWTLYGNASFHANSSLMQIRDSLWNEEELSVESFPWGAGVGRKGSNKHFLWYQNYVIKNMPVSGRQY